MNDHTDPRLSSASLRTVDGPLGTVTLVGVVHDHPASRFRANAVVAAREPDVLALELPPVALPLFEQYARDDRTLPAFGGEMSAAIQAATTDRVVGIDGPSLGFLRRLVGDLSRTDPSPATVRDVASAVFSATRHAVVCRAASAFTAATGVRVEVDSPASYETDVTDAPDVQAADERAHLDRAQSVLDALEPSRSTALRDSVREAHMAENLDRLRREGDVVAVVGLDHLDAIASRLETARTA